MLVRNLKQALVATAGAGALFLGMASSASANPVILNPSATNGNSTCALTTNGLPCQMSATDGAFPTTQADLVFTSDLRINGNVNDAGAAIPVSEVGSFLFTDWGFLNAQGMLTHYNVYGTFTITGFGSWDGLGKFTQTIPGSGTISLYANPVCALGAACAPTFSQATQSPLNLGVTSHSADDFLLATASVIGFAASGLPTATFAGFGGPYANGQNLAAVLALVPTAGTAGLGGFWENVLPTGLNLSVTANNAATGTEVTALANAAGDGCPVATCSVLRTHATFGIGITPSIGTGSVTFEVPEPASLALFGMGVLGLGFMFRRDNKKQARA